MSDTGGAEGEPVAGRSWAPADADPLVRAVFALLVLACLAAFFLTQHLKHTPTAVQRFQLTPRFSPTPSAHIKQEAISFKLASADEVTVAIIDTRGNVVATLLRNYPVERYKQLSLRWNGRRGAARNGLAINSAGHTILTPETRGRLAPPGEYRVRLSLRHHSPVLSPRSFTLVGADG